jgi:hypothetical protein
MLKNEKENFHRVKLIMVGDAELYMCVAGLSILPLFMSFRLDFETVLTVLYLLFFVFVLFLHFIEPVIE